MKKFRFWRTGLFEKVEPPFVQLLAPYNLPEEVVKYVATVLDGNNIAIKDISRIAVADVRGERYRMLTVETSSMISNMVFDFTYSNSNITTFARRDRSTKGGMTL